MYKTLISFLAFLLIINSSASFSLKRLSIEDYRSEDFESSEDENSNNSANDNNGKNDGNGRNDNEDSLEMYEFLFLFIIYWCSFIGRKLWKTNWGQLKLMMVQLSSCMCFCYFIQYFLLLYFYYMCIYNFSIKDLQRSLKVVALVLTTTTLKRRKPLVKLTIVLKLTQKARSSSTDLLMSIIITSQKNSVSRKTLKKK